LIRAPWLETETAVVDLFTPAVVPAHPAVIALALLLQRLQQVAPMRFAAATVLEPASEFGRVAMDELHQQTVNLLNFQAVPAAFTMRRSRLTCWAAWAKTPKSVCLTWKRAFAATTKRSPPAVGPSLAVQVIHAPVFHGLRFPIAVELERPVEIVALEEALTGEHIELVLEDTDSPSNLAATGQNDVLVRLRPELLGRNSNQASRLWLWAAADNLRLNAQNAVQCALDLRRLRPQGTVQ
jgi:aspartate-semialdehyde dehydrogenase